MKKQYLLPVGLAAIGVLTVLKKPQKDRGVIHKNQSYQSQNNVRALETKQNIKAIRGSPNLEISYKYFKMQFATLIDCYHKARCKEKKQGDLSDEAYQSLVTFYAWLLRHGYRSKDISHIVGGFLVFEDLGVKKISLKILSLQPLVDKNASYIFRYIMNTENQELLSLGSEELARYRRLTLLHKERD